MSTSAQDLQHGNGSGISAAASEVTSQAQEKVGEVAEQAKQRASEMTDQGKSALRSQIDERSTQAGSQVRTNAQDLRTVGDELRKQGKETPAKVADQLADRGEKIGSYLESSDAQQILSDVENFARKQPWAVVAGGLALGFLASRFLKSSSSQRYGSGDVYVRSASSLRSELESSSSYRTPPPYQPVSDYSSSPVAEGL